MATSIDRWYYKQKNKVLWLFSPDRKKGFKVFYLEIPTRKRKWFIKFHWFRGDAIPTSFDDMIAEVAKRNKKNSASDIEIISENNEDYEFDNVSED